MLHTSLYFKSNNNTDLSIDEYELNSDNTKIMV